MLKISSTEFQKNPGRYIDRALGEPVTITRHGRETVVMIRPEEYRRLKRRDREVLLVEELSDQDIRALVDAVPPEEAKQFDHELEE